VSGSPVVTRFCPANQWTQVEWYLGTILLTKRYDAGEGVVVRWRWFAAGVPPYWEGMFTGSAWITLTPSAYTSLEFNPSQGVDVRISTR
jgi:hypothetical protein